MHHPPHPGEFIREVYLEPHSMTGRQLASKLGVLWGKSSFVRPELS